MRFASEAERDEAAGFGAVEGAKQTLDRLDAHLAARRNGGETWRDKSRCKRVDVAGRVRRRTER
nr:hypothetical protein [Natronococcus sp. AD5]